MKDEERVALVKGMLDCAETMHKASVVLRYTAPSFAAKLKDDAMSLTALACTVENQEKGEAE